MKVLVEVVGLVAVIFVVSAVSRRLGLLVPVVLVLVGLGLSLVPGLPVLSLNNPDVVLIGILPPLLYVAALQISVPAFRFNLRSILLLGVGLVIFTTVAVGVVVHVVLPSVPLAACLALGAVVAPPDAIAATAVARRIGLPRRVVTVLEGESLINDATALVLFRVSVAAAVGASVSAGAITREVVLAAGGGIAVGAVAAVAIGYLHRKITEPLFDNALSLLTPFLVVLVAELAHASAVVAVVVTGLYLGHRWPTLMSAASRLQMEAFWRMVNFLLEGAVFLLVGLQLRRVVTELSTPPKTAVLVTVAVLGTVVVTRVVWIFPTTYLPRLIPSVRRRDPAPSPKVPAVIAWAGMRGVVTLAAALALPLTLAGGAAYPRGLFVWLAFAVIIATLALQGATLPWVARRLRVPPDDPTEDALAEAAVQHSASRAARARLDELADGAPPNVVDRLRELADQRANVAWERLASNGRETPSQAYVRLRRHMLEAEREVFRTARDEGRIAEEVLRRAQRDMDLEESMLDRTGES
ncbi:MAG TPA: Na+/H+ antiporter [Micromonosporaceae bacterium]